MNYDELVTSLIDFKKQWLIHFSENERKALSPFDYIEKFCTVRLDVGRAVGKTTYIKNHATRDDLIVVKNERILKNIYDEPNLNILEFHNIEWARGRNFKCIYVDDASDTLKDKMDLRKLYSVTYNPIIPQLYILLG